MKDKYFVGVQYTDKKVSPRELELIRNCFRKTKETHHHILMQGIAVYVNELALEQGLSEVAGYYGIDMETGAFITREIDRTYFSGHSKVKK